MTPPGPPCPSSESDAAGGGSCGRAGSSGSDAAAPAGPDIRSNDDHDRGLLQRVAGGGHRDDAAPSGAQAHRTGVQRRVCGAAGERRPEGVFRAGGGALSSSPTAWFTPSAPARRSLSVKGGNTHHMPYFCGCMRPFPCVSPGTTAVQKVMGIVCTCVVSRVRQWRTAPAAATQPNRPQRPIFNFLNRVFTKFTTSIHHLCAETSMHASTLTVVRRSRRDRLLTVGAAVVRVVIIEPKQHMSYHDVVLIYRRRRVLRSIRATRERTRTGAPAPARARSRRPSGTRRRAGGTRRASS
jgi:hypothetical protein